MAQVIPSSEINSILALRGQFRSNGNTIKFPESAMKLIEEIRMEIPSGKDGEGWFTVGANWRSPVKTSNFVQTTKVTDWDRRVTKPSQNSFKGSDSIWGDRPRFTGGKIQRNETIPQNNSEKSAVTTNPPQQKPIINTVPQKYVSKFKANNESLEDTIVNTIINNKLNKFSAANYDDVKEFMMEILGSGERDFLSDFMRLIFTKAAAEQTFCPLYAKLLKELSEKYPFLLDEMYILYERFIDIFQELNEDECKDNEEFIKRNKEKKYRRGYSQFLGEIVKNNIVNKDSFVITLNHIISTINSLAVKDDKATIIDEYSSCLLIILTAIKNNESTKSIRDSISESIKTKLKQFTVKDNKFPSITNKIRFSILDACDCLN